MPGQPFAVGAVAAMTKSRNIPLLVDAAAEDLTIPNVHLQQGATVVAYSGGKALCGPQCAGLLLGRKDILMSAWQASSPHHGPGRDNKVGKEEMLGMLAAVESWVTRDHAEKMRTWHTYLETVARPLTKLNFIKTSIQEPTGLSNHSPSLIISWDAVKQYITGKEAADELANNSPRIAVHSGHDDETGLDSIIVVSGQMQPGNDKIVGDRILAVLSQKRSMAKEMAAPAANISGRWDADIEFYSSRSRQTLFIEQDGNWIRGSHQGDFSLRNMVGTIEGDQVKLSSTDQQVADHVPFIFSGTLSGDSISGQIYMGEYINARFTAIRNTQMGPKKPIRFPKGQPLAT